MPKKGKMKKAPANYYDMEGSVEKDKKVKQSDVFGKQSSAKAKPKSKKTKVKKGSHRMPDGTIMKDSDMKNNKKKKKY